MNAAVPQAVKVMNDLAFRGCSQLTRVVFCDEIEEFVSRDAMRGWWHQGVHAKTPSTYCFLVKCNIPQRLDSLRLIE
jgi:hypothetical protein